MGRRTSRAVVAGAVAVALGSGAAPASADYTYWHPFGPDHVCDLPELIAAPGSVDPWVPDAAARYGDPISPHGAAVYAGATGFAANSPVTITHTFTTTKVEQQRVKVGKRVVVRRVVKRVTRSVVVGRDTTNCWGQYASHHFQPVKVASTGTLRIDGTTWRGDPCSAQDPVTIR